MIDLKSLRSALEQLEEERNIPKEKIIGAIEDALTAAYKKDYGKKGQIVRAKLDFDTGTVDFSQVKIVVDESTVQMDDGGDDLSAPAGDASEPKIKGNRTASSFGGSPEGEEEEVKPRFNEEHHILLDDARKIKKGVELGEEIIFPLETKDDFGRIDAQTAKQVIIQRIREAEKTSVMSEYSDKEGEIVSGKVQKIERGNVFVDLGRATGILPYEDQIPGEFYRQGERIRAYLYAVEETPKGITLRLSRSHPKFIQRLFEIEAPETASGVVEIKATAREAGARSKIAVYSNDESIDAVGSCVGQRGSRVSTVIAELGGEKIDIIEWSSDIATFITNALSPAKVNKVDLDEEEKEAKIEVNPDQFSLAVGKGGQNARLAAKLTGWKIDITTPEGKGGKDREEKSAATEEDEEMEGGMVDDGSEG